MAQFAVPNTFRGVTFVKKLTLLSTAPLMYLLWETLTGIKITQPNKLNTKKMLRHIRRTLKKTVASNPINCTNSCSFVLNTGPTQAKIPFPNGGGACLSSATLSLGAYTTVLYGRSNEKPTARRTVKPMEVPKLA